MNSVHAEHPDVSNNTNHAMDKLAGKGVGVRRGKDVINPLLVGLEEELSYQSSSKHDFNV